MHLKVMILQEEKANDKETSKLLKEGADLLRTPFIHSTAVSRGADDRAGWKSEGVVRPWNLWKRKREEESC